MFTNLSLRARVFIFILIITLATATCAVAGLILYRFVLQPPEPIPTQSILDDGDVSADTGAAIGTPGAPDLAAGSDSGISNSDNITRINTPQFTGICRNDDKINLISSIHGALSHAETVCSGSNYAIALTSALSDGVHSISAIATDPAGNIGQPSSALTITMDTTPPVAPSIPDLAEESDTGSSKTDNITSDITPRFTGTCTPGDTITILSSLDGSRLPEQVCTSGGYDITLTSNLSEVAHSISAQAMDPAGNTSTSLALAVTIETIAPNAPGAPDLAAESDTGISNIDNITNDATPRLTGVCNSGDVISIYSSLDGDRSPEAACVDGHYDITLTSALREGAHSMTAKARDSAGNRSSSLDLYLVVDTTPPGIPGAPDLAGGSDSGRSNSDNITRMTSPRFTGTCPDGNRVSLVSSSGGALSPSNVFCSGGGYDITVNSLLSEVVHSIYAQATDAAGNTSAASGGLGVTVDTVPPSAPGTPDLDAGSDTGSSNTDNITSDTTPRFRGTCLTGDEINLRSSVIGELSPSDAICSGNSYDITVTSALSQATHSITAIAIDLAGNISSASAGLSVTVGPTTPAAPGAPDLAAGSDTGVSNTDNITKLTSPRFTGTCVDGKKINLSSSVDGALNPSNTVCSGGGYDITLTSTLTATTHNITATATDVEGVSPASGALSVTIDVNAPAAPGTPDLAAGSDTGSSNTDNITADATPQFTGSCETNAVVTLSSSVAGVLAPTGTCAGGAFDIILTSVLSETMHNISASQVDVAGNASVSSPALSVNIVIPTLVVNLVGNVGADAATSTGGTPADGPINCPSTRCDTDFLLDDSVTLNVTVDASSSFVGWGGDCAGFGSNLSGSLTMNGDKNCTATFAPPPGPEMDVEGNGVSIADGDDSPNPADHTDFGDVNTGSALDRAFAIQNSGGGALTLTGFPAAVTLSGSGDFSIQTQPGAASIPAGGADLTFVVRCAPTSAGARAATVSIANNDSDENPYNFDLYCTGVGPEIDVQRPAGNPIPDGGADDLGDQSTGTVNLRYTLDNTAGTGQLSVSNVTAANLSNVTDFALHTATPIDVAAGETGTFEISFDVGAGAFSLDIDILDNDGDENPYDIQIIGNGATIPEMEVLGNDRIVFSGDTTPDADDHTDFGDVDVNGATVTRAFTIQNNGTADLTLSGSPIVTIGGAHAADFTLTVDATTPVPAGGETTFTITFDPSDAGARQAVISIASNDGDESPYTFSIEGSGTGPAPEMDVLGNGISIPSGDGSPDTADQTDFGDVNVAGGSVTYTFTIRNTGSVVLNLLGSPIVTLGGDHAADFLLTTDAATPVSSGGGETTFQITFDPSAAGLRQATVSIANDDSDENPYTFSIQGTGVAP